MVTDADRASGHGGRRAGRRSRRSSRRDRSSTDGDIGGRRVSRPRQRNRGGMIRPHGLGALDARAVTNVDARRNLDRTLEHGIASHGGVRIHRR